MLDSFLYTERMIEVIPHTDVEFIGGKKTAEEEFLQFTTGQGNFPVNFVYGGTYYEGFRGFRLVNKSQFEIDGKICIDYNYVSPDSIISATLKSVFYPEYSAYEWTVWFENVGDTKSQILKKINVADLRFVGENPVLKSIRGDHQNNYVPYEVNLSEKFADIYNDSGRPTHIEFPYFNLETDCGGVLAAIGWPGCWDGWFQSEKDITRFKAFNTLYFSACLNPGEKIRTALLSLVRYSERDEDKAINAWRRWYTECNMPYEHKGDSQRMQPIVAAYFPGDTGKPNSDGSISEDCTTWRKTFESLKRNKITYDYNWFDAGWYEDENGNTLKPSDDWRRLGTLTLDKAKWPDNTFREKTDEMRRIGVKNLMWFEYAYVTDDPMILCERYGVKKEWLIPCSVDVHLFDLSDRECFDWVFNKITTVMTECGVDLFREDFNSDPAISWKIMDALERSGHRYGISENKWVQAYLELWDKIIAYCGENGKSTVIDACASGGGRNDLESMRRVVPFLRSDADRAAISRRLAYTWSLSRWLPFTGMSIDEKEYECDYKNTSIDAYSTRASFSSCFTLSGAFSDENYPYEALRKAIDENKRFAKYILKDYYALTPYCDITNQTDWQAYMFFDREKDSAVLVVFRPAKSPVGEKIIKVKGVSVGNHYNLIDEDGLNDLLNVSGEQLLSGITVKLDSPRSTALYWINA